MKGNQLVRTFALVGLILSLVICWQEQSAIAQSAKNTAESPIKGIQAPEPPKVSPKARSTSCCVHKALCLAAVLLP